MCFRIAQRTLGICNLLAGRQLLVEQLLHPFELSGCIFPLCGSLGILHSRSRCGIQRQERITCIHAFALADIQLSNQAGTREGDDN